MVVLAEGEENLPEPFKTLGLLIGMGVLFVGNIVQLIYKIRDKRIKARKSEFAQETEEEHTVLANWKSYAREQKKLHRSDMDELKKAHKEDIERLEFGINQNTERLERVLTDERQCQIARAKQEVIISHLTAMLAEVKPGFKQAMRDRGIEPQPSGKLPTLEMGSLDRRKVDDPAYEGEERRIKNWDEGSGE